MIVLYDIVTKNLLEIPVVEANTDASRVRFIRCIIEYRDTRPLRFYNIQRYKVNGARRLH